MHLRRSADTARPATRDQDAQSSGHEHGAGDARLSLILLLRQVELLAPQLSREQLLSAGQCVLKLAERCPAEQRAYQSDDDSPLQPTNLSFSTGVEPMHWTGADAAASRPPERDEDDGGSVGSLEGEACSDEGTSPTPSESGDASATELAPLFAPSVLGGTDLMVPLYNCAPPEYEDWDDVGWHAPSPSRFSGFAYPSGDGGGTGGETDDAEPPSTDGCCECDEPVERARSSGWRGAHDSIGLAEFGRCVYCDVCDLNMSNGACMAGYVLEERRVASVVTKHTKMHARKPWGDLDRREARHALYKAVIFWQFCSDLGAGNRVRLPKCVVLAIRGLFPSPLCGRECDLWVACEGRRHYTGFRTAEESRAHREGRYIDLDVRI